MLQRFVLMILLPVIAFVFVTGIAFLAAAARRGSWCGCCKGVGIVDARLLGSLQVVTVKCPRCSPAARPDPKRIHS